MEWLKDTLASNPQQAVQAISQLRVIGVALGAARTRTELLPYLTIEIQQGNLNDEVLFSLAEVLGSVVDCPAFISHDDCGSLLAPLRELCCVEETVVREAAVASVRAIGKEVPAVALFPILLPIVLGLGEQADWYTPRVSACGMLPLAYQVCATVEHGHAVADSAHAAGASAPAAAPAPAAEAAAAAPAAAVAVLSSSSDEELDANPATPASAAASGGARGGSAELLALFRSLVADESAAVRRAAALGLGELADALGGGVRAARSLSSCIAALLADETETVRLAALNSCAGVACALAYDARPHDLAALRLVACARDKSWHVRVAAAEALPSVASAPLGGALAAKEMCMPLVDDFEPDVRVAVALQAASLASSLGAEYVTTALLPPLRLLLSDDSVDSRVELASVLMQLIRPLGADVAASELLPTVLLALDDVNTSVRLSVVSRLADLIQVVGVGPHRSPTGAGAQRGETATAAQTASASSQHELLPVLVSLCDDASWRVRHATLLLLPALALHLDVDVFMDAFVRSESCGLDRRATDSCALIRTDWISVRAAAPAFHNSSPLPAYSAVSTQAPGRPETARPRPCPPAPHPPAGVRRYRGARQVWARVARIDRRPGVARAPRRREEIRAPRRAARRPRAARASPLRRGHRRVARARAHDGDRSRAQPAPAARRLAAACRRVHACRPGAGEHTARAARARGR